MHYFSCVSLLQYDEYGDKWFLGEGEVAEGLQPGSLG